MAKYKKVEVDDKSSHLRPVSLQDIEKEILKVRDVAISEEMVRKANKKIQEKAEKDLMGYKEPKEEPKEEPKKPAKLGDGRMVKRMRLRDRHFNKTCAACLRRVPLDKIGGGKDNVCDDCK